MFSSFAYHTPLLNLRLLSERTGFDVRLKAEMFQKGGSYKLRGPLNKFRHLTEEPRSRGGDGKQCNATRSGK